MDRQAKACHGRALARILLISLQFRRVKRIIAVSFNRLLLYWP